jgi:serine O-acetyltransferase
MSNPVRTFFEDLDAPLARDPAARGRLDVLLSYPGFHAIFAYRAIHALARTGVPLLPRFLSNVARWVTGIEIHPAATIGHNVFIDHGMGVVVGETAEVGDGCTIYQGVTLGGTSLSHGKRHPTVGKNVTIGANSSVFGAVVIGDNAKIGGGSVVVKDVPAGATVVGVPARVVAINGEPVHRADHLPSDAAPIAETPFGALSRLQKRVDLLESRLAEFEDDDDVQAWSWVI